MSKTEAKDTTKAQLFAENLRDIILGGQDGLVNVLGIALGVGTVALATNDTRIVLVAGLAATFAESFSMGAVAYTSSKAERDHFLRQHQEAGGTDEDFAHDAVLRNPFQSAAVVGFSALIGSFVPLLPFFFLDIGPALIGSIIVSALVLFVAGAVKAKLTIGDWRWSGLEIMVIGMAAAAIGYVVGLYFKVTA